MQLCISLDKTKTSLLIQRKIAMKLNKYENVWKLYYKIICVECVTARKPRRLGKC